MTPNIQTPFSANSQTTNFPITNIPNNILWGGAAAALLGATLAEWQKKRQEEEAARLAALRNSGGEEDEGGSRKKTPGQIAYEKKQQQKQIVAESQALMNQKKARQQASAKAMQDHRAGEKNAVAIAAAYESQKAIQSHRDGERDAVAIAEEYKSREQEKNMGGRKPLAMPTSQTDDWLINYEREAAMEMYRIGEQNPDISFNEIVATLALRKFRINNPAHHFTEDGNTNCANFVSHIWWQAGIRFPDSDWNIEKFRQTPLDLLVWNRVINQQALFSSHHGEFRIVYSDVAGQPGVLRDQPSFNNILQNYPQIFQPGSAIFYYNSFFLDPKSAWQHAAILEPQGMPTSFFYPSSSNSIISPSLVEQDGLFDFNDLPRDIRSLDDTPNERLTQISIIPTQPINPSLYNISPSELSSAILDGKSCYTVQSGGEGNFSLYYCPPTP